jgi:hypothetical protein
MADDAQIREVMAVLGRLRWAGKSKAERSAHALKMVTARERKRKRAKAKRTG